MTEGKVGIILVCTNEKRHLDLLYKSITNQTYHNFSIYFIDNNSSDGSAEYLKELNRVMKLDIRYISLKENSGFAKGNNIGADAALKDGCDYVFIINPDMELADNVLEILKRTCTDNDEIGVCSSVLLFGCDKRDKDEIQFYGGKANFKTQKKDSLFSGQILSEAQLPKLMTVDFVNGGSTFVRKDVIQNCGLFEEKYFIYNDEIDFAYRIQKAGYKTVVTSATKIWHHHDWSSKKNYQVMYYYMMRNRYLYFKKFKLYANLFLDIFIQVITIPAKIKWFRRLSNYKVFKFYYLGILKGILGEEGKARISIHA